MIKENWEKQFKKNFFEKCCRLVCKAKSDLKPKYLFEKKYKGREIKKEDLVTFDYVRKMKELVYSENLPINIENDSNQENMINNKKLVNPDIIFETRNLQNKTFFECKILGDNTKYVTRGLIRFVIEKYSSNRMPFYGMLGYVKNEKASRRYETLKKIIKEKEKELFLKSKNKKKNSNNEFIFDTKHKILKSKNNNSEIVVSHILHSWEK